MRSINEPSIFGENKHYDYDYTFPENQIDNDSYFKYIYGMTNIPTYEPEIEDEKYEENNPIAGDNYEKKIFNEPKSISAYEKTKMTTNFIGQKTKRSNDGYDLAKESKNIKNLENEFNNEKTKSTQGRKKKEVIDKGNHTKYAEDNIMRKIKSYFLTLSHNLLNESLNDKDMVFLKLDSFVNENLKKQYNIDLLNTKMKDLYYESKISSKYRKQAKVFADKNKKLINKILNDKTKLQTIKILNLTYRELFNVFRRNLLDINNDLKMKIKDIPLLEKEQYNNINLFFIEIYKQEKNKNESKENIDIYINNIKDLCMNYESWFLNKKGRNRISKLAQKNNIDN